MLKNLRNTFRLKSFIIAAILFSLLTLSGNFAFAQQKSDGRWLPKPADWSNNEWYQFVESSVQIVLGEGYSAVGGKFPLIDVYSALSAVGGSTKTALQFWLRKKMTDALSAEDWKRANRYEAFYTCLTQGECAALREIQIDLEDVMEEQADDDDEEIDSKQNKGNNNTISGKYLDWNGIWVADNNRITFTISGDRKTFSISFRYIYGPHWGNAKGSGNLTNCKIDGNKGTCDWQDNFETDDYTSSPVRGTMTLTLFHDFISVSIAVIPDTWTVSWKGGKELYRAERHSMFIKDGFNNSFNQLTRQK